MLAIVRLALSRPYTFVVLAILIVIFGVLAAVTTPTDIFPDINIPVISVVWTYNGLPPDDMAGRVVYYYERTLTHAASTTSSTSSAQSLPGYGVVKIFFQPSVNISAALAQVTAISQTVLKQMPPGHHPALRPELQRLDRADPATGAVQPDRCREQKLFDLARTSSARSWRPWPGAAIPSPYGGKVRQVQIDLNHDRAAGAYGLSAAGRRERHLRAEPDHPGRHREDRRVRIQRQAQRQPRGRSRAERSADQDGQRRHRSICATWRTCATASPPQTNIVRVERRARGADDDPEDGLRLDARHRRRRQGAAAADQREPAAGAPIMRLIGDQSVFVNAAVSGVVREGVIAAALTGADDPAVPGQLALHADHRHLDPAGRSSPRSPSCRRSAQTLNVMTLGGLALAVGILVDDATVTIENINWHLEQGKDVDAGDPRRRPADRRRRPSSPLLCICIVFVPMFMLGGVAGFLFVPMAEAVVFAMIASFVLSRTLVPTLANYLLHAPAHRDGEHDAGRSRAIPWCASSTASSGFERDPQRLPRPARAWRSATARVHRRLPRRRRCCPSASCPSSARTSFPPSTPGRSSCTSAAQTGTRIEETAPAVRPDRAADPPDHSAHAIWATSSTTSACRSAASTSPTATPARIGPEDGDILIASSRTIARRRTIVRTLRAKLPREFPGASSPSCRPTSSARS